jgi:hypothetical protein
METVSTNPVNEKAVSGNKAGFRYTMRTLLNCFLFVLIIAALLIGSALETSGSLRNPWTWILVLLGAAIFEGLTYWIYKRRPTKRD